jgi:hypothetical protein
MISGDVRAAAVELPLRLATMGISCSLPLGRHQARNGALLRNKKENFRVFPLLPRVPRLPFRHCGLPERQFSSRPSLDYLSRQVVKRAAEEEADGKIPSLLALKLRDEIGRSHVQRHAGGERQPPLLEDRELLRQ